MNVTSIEIRLPRIDARWVAVGFGVDCLMSRLPTLLCRLGPQSIRFPDTTWMSLGVPRLSTFATSAYILVVDHEDAEATVGAHQLARDLAGGDCLEVLMDFGRPSRPIPVREGTLHVSLAETAGSEWVVASLLMAVTANGLIGIDLQDFRRSLHGTWPARSWFWQGRSGQVVADATGDLARAAAEADIPSTGVSGAAVITIVPPTWTLHDIAELSGSVKLLEGVDCVLAAFIDDGPNQGPAAIVLTYSIS